MHNIEARRKNLKKALETWRTTKALALRQQAFFGYPESSTEQRILYADEKINDLNRLLDELVESEIDDGGISPKIVEYDDYFGELLDAINIVLAETHVLEKRVRKLETRLFPSKKTISLAIWAVFQLVLSFAHFFISDLRQFYINGMGYVGIAVTLIFLVGSAITISIIRSDLREGLI